MAATAIRIVVLCLAAAMICASLRAHRPEMAMAVSLAVGVAAAYLGSRDFGVFGRGLVGHLVRLRERTYALALRHEDDLPLLRHEGREPAPQSQGDGAGVRQREDGGRTAAPRR